MKRIRAHLGKCLAVTTALCLAGSMTAASGAAWADEGGQPTSTFPDNVCGEYVKSLPVLKDDLTPEGKAITPKPLNGKATPVILVHGWTAHAGHTNHDPHQGSSQFSLWIDRVADGAKGYTLPKNQVMSSFIGALQNIPGAAVYMFDYEKVNTHWVTDPQIGKKLANGIECLANHYGNKAIVIGHSMGGLAARQALSERDATGVPASEHVAQLLTFGTPNTGTLFLKIGYDVVDYASIPPFLGLPVRLAKMILQKCSDLADQTGQFCLGIGGPPDGMYTEGARAMVPGSAAMRALPQVPDTVPYTAYAGDVKLGGFSLFGFHSARLVDVGDFAVNYDSAIAGANETKTASCEYGIVSIFSNKHHLSIKERLSGSRTTHLLLPLDLTRELATPCYHNNLMSEVGLVNAAIDKVTTVVNNPVPNNSSEQPGTESPDTAETAPTEVVPAA